MLRHTTGEKGGLAQRMREKHQDMTPSLTSCALAPAGSGRSVAPTVSARGNGAMDGQAGNGIERREQNWRALASGGLRMISCTPEMAGKRGKMAKSDAKAATQKR